MSIDRKPVAAVAAPEAMACKTAYWLLGNTLSCEG
jgi:hypothetical protein